ncbi:MAG: cytochrome c biogenesis protein CcdA [Thermoanaerobaculia bacterium]
MKAHTTFLSILAALTLSIVPAQAQISFSLPGADSTASQHVRVEAHITSAEGDHLKGVANVEIEKGWHINSAHPLDDYSIPTTLELDSKLARLVKADYPPHVVREFSFANGKLAVYEGRFAIPFELERTAPGAGTLKFGVHYQSCNDNVCLPPKTATTDLQIPAGPVTADATPAPAAATETAATASVPPPAASTSAADFTPLPAAGEEVPNRGLFSSDIGSTLASHGLPLTLAVIFVLGLALNLTPCVYPLIPITVAFFASQGEGSRARQVGLSSSYVLGLAATYSLLGVFAALSGKMFGIWLQSPAVLIFFALLMLVLSASMFGLYEIRVPQFITRQATARAGYAGAVTMGLLAGIVAAPCVGPFVISMITVVGQKGEPFFGFLLFFVLALGLGLPYLLLGIFSSSLRSMPRSGVWLVHVERALGFILIAMAFYFLRPVLGDEVYRWGVAGSLLLGAAYLVFRGMQLKQARTVPLIAGVILLAGGIFLAIPPRTDGGIQWKPYDEKHLAAAAASGKPVLIDFYADWCLPCKELDEKTFNEPKVAAEASRFVTLRADLTRTADPTTVALSERYAIRGVPTIVFIDSAGRELSADRLTGFEPASKFLQRLSNVR